MGRCAKRRHVIHKLAFATSGTGAINRFDRTIYLRGFRSLPTTDREPLFERVDHDQAIVFAWFSWFAQFVVCVVWPACHFAMRQPQGTRFISMHSPQQTTWRQCVGMIHRSWRKPAIHQVVQQAVQVATSIDVCGSRRFAQAAGDGLKRRCFVAQ